MKWEIPSDRDLCHTMSDHLGKIKRDYKKARPVNPE